MTENDSTVSARRCLGEPLLFVYMPRTMRSTQMELKASMAGAPHSRRHVASTSDSSAVKGLPSPMVSFVGSPRSVSFALKSARVAIGSGADDGWLGWKTTASTTSWSYEGQSRSRGAPRSRTSSKLEADARVAELKALA